MSEPLCPIAICYASALSSVVSLCWYQIRLDGSNMYSDEKKQSVDYFIMLIQDPYPWRETQLSICKSFHPKGTAVGSHPV